MDHHVVAVKNREDIPYSRTDIIPVQLLLRLSERRLRRDRIDQPVVFVPGSIDDRPALRCSAVTADLRRPPYKERVRDLALRAMNPVSGILCRAAGDREIENIRKCTQVPVHLRRMIHMHIIGGIIPLIPAVLRRHKTFAQNLRKHLAPERYLHSVRIKLLIF